jgi:hypothetical protein
MRCGWPLTMPSHVLYLGVKLNFDGESHLERAILASVIHVETATVVIHLYLDTNLNSRPQARVQPCVLTLQKCYIAPRWQARVTAVQYRPRAYTGCRR